MIALVEFFVTLMCSLCVVKLCVICLMCKFFCFPLPQLANKDEYRKMIKSGKITLFVNF